MTSLPFSTLRHILSWFLCSLNRFLFLKMKQKRSSDAGLDIFGSSEVFVDPPRKPEESKFASLRKKKRKKEGRRGRRDRREPNIGTVFISLCGRLQRDEWGQWRERRPFRTNTLGPAWHTHMHTHVHTAWLRQFDSMRGGVFIFKKATLFWDWHFTISLLFSINRRLNIDRGVKLPTRHRSCVLNPLWDGADLFIFKREATETERDTFSHWAEEELQVSCLKCLWIWTSRQLD